VESFTASGNPTYDSSGAHFTVATQLTSLFYIMFGKVSITMKSAPGAGIVSTLVLQSDTLDEIDMEWLGADDTEVQTNYFGKGDVTTYNRGAFNPAANNQGQFITYDIEWTQSQITWSVGGKVVRVLTPATADANQYPQSPMQVKFGSWSGGDAATNAPGTIEWARGPTDWSKGPFTMSVSSIQVVDYSTGTQYKYGDTSGSWQSIQAVGGKVNGNAGGAGTVIASADAPAITSASPAIPAGLGSNTHTDTAHQTGWPWVGTSTFATVTTVPTTASLPSGWIITSSGKVMPASSAAVSAPPLYIPLLLLSKLF
jgi:beta-glucanase (GH16 family)